MERRKEYVLQGKYSNSLSGANRTFNLTAKRMGEKKREKKKRKSNNIAEKE